jgi:hypothetical protein
MNSLTLCYQDLFTAILFNDLTLSNIGLSLEVARALSYVRVISSDGSKYIVLKDRTFGSTPYTVSA